jgi:hypothetical protein
MLYGGTKDIIITINAWNSSLCSARPTAAWREPGLLHRIHAAAHAGQRTAT